MSFIAFGFALRGQVGFKILGIDFQQFPQRLQVLRHPPEDLFLLDVLCFRCSQRPFKGEFACKNFFQGFHGQTQREIGFEQRSAESLSCNFDLFFAGCRMKSAGSFNRCR